MHILEKKHREANFTGCTMNLGNTLPLEGTQCLQAEERFRLIYGQNGYYMEWSGLDLPLSLIQ